MFPDGVPGLRGRLARGSGGRRALVAVAVALALLAQTPMCREAGSKSSRPQAPGGSFVSEKAGFTLIHLEGDPRTIGLEHGRLLADKIERGMAAYAHCSMDWYGFTWAQCRATALLFWTRVPAEYQQEIQGIAEGAASAGVRNPDGALVDWIDVLAYNAQWDIWWTLTSPGNPLWWWPFHRDEEWPHHCSGFVATGPDWTADGGFVLAQSLWMPYFLPPAHAVWCDLVPNQGNRIFMQLTAGMIWSGTEYYINSAGLVAAETTLGHGAHVWGGTPAFVRVRRAIQYASTIDEFREQMLRDTNGAYCSDYLLADVKSNEVAVLELGGRTWALARTSNGFLPSCNYPWDPTVAAEMGAPQGAAHGCWPRWIRIQDLCNSSKGNITVEFGKALLGDHYDTTVGYENPGRYSLCGHGENTTRGYPHGSQDGKVTNRTMASRMQVWARYGHSCGQPFYKELHAAEHPDYAFDDLEDMIAGPWSTFGALNPLELSVLDSSGQPVRGSRVRAEDVYDGNTTWFELPEGRLLIERFMTGVYNFTAEKGGLKVRERFEVSGPRSVELFLRESGSGSVAGGHLAVAAGAAGIAAVSLGWVMWRRMKNSRVRGRS
ncbi:MAG: C45 family peptidase [Thermoplasmata archaeon]